MRYFFGYDRGKQMHIINEAKEKFKAEQKKLCGFLFGMLRERQCVAQGAYLRYCNDSRFASLHCVGLPPRKPLPYCPYVS